MKTCIIVVPEKQTNLSSIVGPYKILTRANEFWKRSGRNDVLQIVVAGSSARQELYDGLFSIQPHTQISSVRSADLIIIPSLNHEVESAMACNDRLINWLRRQHEQGSEIASICTGAFLLASTGLLDGKTCSTHWGAADKFRRMFPGVNLVADKVVTDEHGLYTNGGAYAFLHLILYIIEKYFDRKTALYCAKVFQIDMDRTSQSPFMIFSGQKEHNDDIIRRSQEHIENNLADKITIEDLAAKFLVSRRNFDRRFLKATGNTPIEYLQRVRIEAAKRALESGVYTINEIMYKVGYSDVKAFREVFRKITGLSPLAYRNKFNKSVEFAV